MSYFVPCDPGSNEHGTYNRSTVPFFWDQDNPGVIRWQWRYAQGVVVSQTARARMVVLRNQGEEPIIATDWQLSDEGKLGYFTFKFELPDGHYLAIPEIDIAKVRVYVAGQVLEQAVTPSATFEITVETDTPGELPIEHSFVDAMGNESARFTQVVLVPDVQAPAAPTQPLVVVSVVWA